MADEIKKVIQIDTGNSITSLKEYKQHIDELRGSLLELDKDSEEYAAIAEEIRKEQDNLNSVMKVGKDYADAEAGSYNQLVQTMSELKKQWRATADEAERAALGSKILEINNQLKDLDASTGNFQRNVGDYGNAFEEAFKSGLDKVQGLGGSVGSLASDIKKLIPLIKATSKAATTGVEGVKASISSTGIGGIIIILSTLITKLMEFVKKSQEAVDTTKDFERAQDDAKKAVDMHNKELQRQITIMRSLGATSVETAKMELDSQQTLVDNQKALIKEREKELESLKKNRLIKQKAKEEFIAADEAELKALREVLAQQEEVLTDRQNAYDAAVNAQMRKINEAARQALMTQEQLLKEEYDNDIKFMQEHGATEAEMLQRTQQYQAELKALREAQKKDTEDQTQKDKEEAKALEEVIKAEEKRRDATLKGLEKTAEQEQFDLDYGDEILTEQEKASRIYEINRQLIEDEIALQELYLENFKGSTDQKIEEEIRLSDYRQKLANLDKKRAKEVADYETQQANEAAENKKRAYFAGAAAIGSIFGSLSQMFDEGSEEQKSLAIAEATVNTIAGAIGAFMQATAAYPPPYGQIIGGITAAAATAAGIAQINKIKSTTRQSAQSSSNMSIDTSYEQGVMNSVGVTPLLNEQADIQAIQSINVEGDSSKEQQNIKVYVTESDISDATHKAEVRDGNSTF